MTPITKSLRSRENFSSAFNMAVALVVVGRAGFFYIRFDDEAVGAYITSARFKACENLYPFSCTAPKGQHTHLILIPNLGIYNGKVPKAL